MTKKQKEAPLEQGLLHAMRALDNQIARRMQRSPAEREQKGVQKWEPYEQKLEQVTAYVMNAFGDQEVQLDSVIVLSLAFTKCLYLLTEDLGEDGLGEVRASYCRAAMERIARDAARSLQVLEEEKQILN